MKAMLLLDPDRETEQRAFVAERAHVLADIGGGLWVEMDEAQVERFALAGIRVQPREGSDLIELPAVVFDPNRRLPQVPPALSAPASCRHHVIQFIAPPDEDWIQAIQDAGGDYLGPVPQHAALFALAPDLATVLREEAQITWVGLYHPAYAMSYALAGRDEPFDADGLASAQPTADAVRPRVDGALRVEFFADVEDAAATEALQTAGAEVVGRSGDAWLVNPPAAGLVPLLRAAGVRGVEPNAESGLCNQRAGIILGANQVRRFGLVDYLVNLDGEGEIVGIFDTGLDNGLVPTAHTDFNVAGSAVSRVIRADNLNPVAAGNAQDGNGHGTHVAGSIAGDGRNAPGPVVSSPNNSVPRGIAPACRLLLTSVNNVTAPTPANPALDFSRHAQAVLNHYAAGARVQSNSWGSFSPGNHYQGQAGTLDRLAVLMPDLLILFAAGNGEGDRNDSGSPDQNRLSLQGCAKNVLTIGASENVTGLDGDGRSYQASSFPCNLFGTSAGNAVRVAANVATPFSMSDNAQDIALFSCRGRVRNPTDPTHRRTKPDLVAPGTNILSTRSSVMPQSATLNQVCPPTVIANPEIAVTAPPARYWVISGTSMATPLAAGAALLTRQFYRQRFGQLRRPQLVQALPQMVDRPVAVARGSRRVLAWVRRDTAAARNDLQAALYDTEAAPDGTIVTLVPDAGEHPSPALAIHGEHTLLLWRDITGALRLAAFDAALQPLAGFGTAGVVTLQAAVRTDDDRRPALCVQGDECGVVWVRAGADEVLFQRWHPLTGAALDAQPTRLGDAALTSPHPWLHHDGRVWTAFWAGSAGSAGAAMRVLQMRAIGGDGHPQGSAPVTLVSQPAALGAPHAVWDAAYGTWMVVYLSLAAAARGLHTLRVDPAGSPVGGGPRLTVPLAVDARSPSLHLHPDGGHVLLWEDASQNGSFDLYLSFLDALGVAGSVHRQQISDTPHATQGFSAVVDEHGIVPVWQSNDEADADVMGLFLLGVTRYGVFAAQQDAATPLLERQFYTRQTLSEQTELDRVAVAMVWAGGDFYFLRHTGTVFMSDLQLVHVSADGVPDTAFGPGGARSIEQAFGYEALSLAWSGSLLAASSSHGPDNHVYLLRPTGELVPGFGTQGVLDLHESSAATVYGQVAVQGSGATLQVIVAFGQHDAGGSHPLRYTVRSRTGAALVAPRTLARAAGTARQGWFHWLARETPAHAIAAWHTLVGGVSQVQVQRFRFNGTAQAGQPAPFVLTSAPGEAMNATLAPRPIQFAPGFPVSAADWRDSRRREFGAAWQHRSPGGRWEIRFSRLGRTGAPVGTAGQFDVVVVGSAADHATEPQLVWHGDGYGLAWLQQAVAGGPHALRFTVLDPLGQRPDLAASAPVPAPAADFPVTTDKADVQRFHLVWTGNGLRITWTEVEGGRLRHRQRGLAVPRPASGTRFDAPFQQPSAALIKATLINGATNLRNTALPNIGNHVNDGYGWGRINLRQALAPAQPVSFHVRDDASVGAGRQVRYALRIRRGTQLLRITLAWTDPPGADLVNHLHLRVTTPGGLQVFHGNRFRTATGQTHLSQPVTVPEPAFEDRHPVQQVVLAAPPVLPEGEYQVEVICSSLGGGAFQQFPGQPFALVVVGSGPEFRTAATPGVSPAGVY